MRIDYYSENHFVNAFAFFIFQIQILGYVRLTLLSPSYLISIYPFYYIFILILLSLLT